MDEHVQPPPADHGRPGRRRHGRRVATPLAALAVSCQGGGRAAGSPAPPAPRRSTPRLPPARLRPRLRRPPPLEMISRWPDRRRCPASSAAARGRCPNYRRPPPHRSPPPPPPPPPPEGAGCSLFPVRHAGRGPAANQARAQAGRSPRAVRRSSALAPPLFGPSPVVASARAVRVGGRPGRRGLRRGGLRMFSLGTGNCPAPRLASRRWSRPTRRMARGRADGQGGPAQMRGSRPPARSGLPRPADRETAPGAIPSPTRSCARSPTSWLSRPTTWTRQADKPAADARQAVIGADEPAPPVAIMSRKRHGASPGPRGQLQRIGPAPLGP